MMYMSGNSLQIFSIMMVFMLFKGPIQGLIATNAQFVKFETESNRAKIWGCKAVYVLMQFALLGMGVWKVNAMGLLPYVSTSFPLCLLYMVSLTFIVRRGRIGWHGSRREYLWSVLTLHLVRREVRDAQVTSPNNMHGLLWYDAECSMYIEPM